MSTEDQIPTHGLSQHKIQQIESLALDLLIDVYGSANNIKSPVDLAPLLRKHKISVYLAEFEEEDLAGMYRRSQKAIYLKEGDIYVRQIFTIAHQLGHFFLHPHREEETFYHSEQYLLDEAEKIEEKEANLFAASLLMPKPNVQNLTFLFKKVEEISALFKVSNSTAYYRLKNLGILVSG